MNAEKQKRLEAKGWKFGDAEEFLMTDQERESMEAAFSKAFDVGCKIKTSTGYLGGATDDKTRAMYESIWQSAKECHQAATANNGGAMRRALESMIQIYTDLERDIQTDCANRGAEYRTWPLANEALAKAQQALSSTPTAEGKWIAVGDRLPESSQAYSGIYLVSTVADSVTLMGWFGRDERWLDVQGNVVPIEKILAWQPLPEPYTPHGQEGQ